MDVCKDGEEVLGTSLFHSKTSTMLLVELQLKPRNVTTMISNQFTCQCKKTPFMCYTTKKNVSMLADLLHVRISFTIGI